MACGWKVKHINELNFLIGDRKVVGHESESNAESRGNRFPIRSVKLTQENDDEVKKSSWE